MIMSDTQVGKRGLLRMGGLGGSLLDENLQFNPFGNQPGTASGTFEGSGASPQSTQQSMASSQSSEPSTVDKFFGYAGQLLGGILKGQTDGQPVVSAPQPRSSGMVPLLLIGAAAVGAYFILRKKRPAAA